MSKTIDMGTPESVTVEGCAVFCDGEETDGWNSRTGKARAGWQVWTLSAEQIAALKCSAGAHEADEAAPMRGFTR